jgi:prophage regulatory protein
MKSQTQGNSMPPPAGNGLQPMVSPEELSTILGVSKRTLWRLVSAKLLPKPLRIGGSVRWRRDQIQQWIEQGCPGPDHRTSALKSFT